MKYKTCILGCLLIVGTSTVYAIEGGTDGTSAPTTTPSIVQPLKAVGATALNYGIVTSIPTALALPVARSLRETILKEISYKDKILSGYIMLQSALAISGAHRYLLRSKLFFELTRHLHHSSPKLYYGTAGVAGYTGTLIIMSTKMIFVPINNLVDAICALIGI